MNLVNVLLAVLVVLLILAFPVWPHSVGYGYWPASGLGLILLIVLIILIARR